jgi:signal transduction histidine kinase
MKNRIAIKITMLYLALGFLWILFSDQFIYLTVKSADSITILQTYKGWFFVVITSVLLFYLIRKEIHKKEEVEKRLTQAKSKAEEADLLKSAFISNMSHEIRTPLNGILGFCELILDDSFTTEEKKVFAKNLTKNGSDLLKLINDIMDISKIQENQFEIVKKRFNLNDLLEILYYEYQHSDLKELRKNVSFKLVNNEKSPRVDMISDSVRLTHILRNLLNNAFFFTPEGFIHFGFEETESGIELFVEDSGCGIDESSKDHIFKPFFKGKSMVVGNKGFGLGLAISKGLVKLLGSDLKFKTQVNVGTRFYFGFDKNNITIKKPEHKEC